MFVHYLKRFPNPRINKAIIIIIIIIIIIVIIIIMTIITGPDVAGVVK